MFEILLRGCGCWFHSAPQAAPQWLHSGGSVFFKSDTFRVQMAPFDKITTDFCRSRRRLHDSDLILTKNPNIWPKIPKIPQKSQKIPQNPWIPRISRALDPTAMIPLDICPRSAAVMDWFEVCPLFQKCHTTSRQLPVHRQQHLDGTWAHSEGNRTAQHSIEFTNNQQN